MAGVIKTKQGITTDGKKGGIFIGDRHSNKSGGIPIVIDGGGSALVEDSEPIIVPEAVNNPKKHLFDGKQMTSKEILSEINTRYKGVSIKKKGGILERGGLVKSGLNPIDKILILAEPFIEKIVKERISALENKGEPISEYEEQFIRLDLTYDLTKALGNYLQKEDEVIDPYFKTEKGVIVLYARVKRGNKDYRFLTQMIVAGGKNIQVRHYRYLVDTDLPHNRTNEATKNIDNIIKSKKKNERILSDIKYNENTIKRWQNEIEEYKKEVNKRNSITDEKAFSIALKNQPQYKHIFEMTYIEAKKEGVPVAQRMTEEEYKQYVGDFKNELIENEKGVDKINRDIINKIKYIKDLEKKNDKIKSTLNLFEQGGTLSNEAPIPVKSGSVIITRNAALDNKTKHNFNGEQLTNREVLSKINEGGGGVSFGDGGKVEEVEINKDNYYKSTNCGWEILNINNKAWDKLDELKKKEGAIYKESPNANGLYSKYLIDGDEVYRMSNHWGWVSTCNWKLLNNKIPDWLWRRKPFVLAKANFKDFKYKERPNFDKYGNGGQLTTALSILQKTNVPALFQQAKEDNPEELIKYIAEQGQGLHDDNKEALYNSTCKMFTKELTDACIEAYLIKESGGIIDCGCNHEKGGTIEDMVICQNCGWSWNVKDKEPNEKRMYLCDACTYDNLKYYK